MRMVRECFIDVFVFPHNYRVYFEVANQYMHERGYLNNSLHILDLVPKTDITHIGMLDISAIEIDSCRRGVWEFINEVVEL
jgi:hypothetical protein